jgi:2-methoxy-6-polyprenyl-1,4-benzoquinol methylase
MQLSCARSRRALFSAARRVGRAGSVARASSSASSSGDGGGSSSGSSSSGDDSTHFGFRTVPTSEKERLVGDVFDSVASQYDLMNDLMSAGIHRFWKDAFVDMLGLSSVARPEALHILDVAGGTGDIAFRMARQLGRPSATRAAADGAVGGGRIVVSDINQSMLDVGKARAGAKGGFGAAPPFEWIAANAEELPFESGSFDVYTIAFGIRNVTHIDAALREAHRVLRPGGRFLCLEFSQVANPLLRLAYQQYSFEVIPRLGSLVTGDGDSYAYLVESIARFPPQAPHPPPPPPPPPPPTPSRPAACVARRRSSRA